MQSMRNGINYRSASLLFLFERDPTIIPLVKDHAPQRKLCQNKGGECIHQFRGRLFEEENEEIGSLGSLYNYFTYFESLAMYRNTGRARCVSDHIQRK